MRPLSTRQVLSSFLAIYSVVISAISIDCSDILVDKKQFNLKALEGPHSLYKVEKHLPMIKNTTFTIDICRPLEKTKGVPKGEDCPNGSRVCAIKRVTNTIEEKTLIEATIPIAGEFSHSKGGALDPKWTRLKTSSDEKREGLRLEMHGGNFVKQKQQATVEFICRKEAGDKLRRGEKNLDASDDNEDPGDEDEDDSKEGQEVDDEHGGTLRYKSWSIEGGVNVLRLDWHTKYACEDASSPSDGPSSGHWGFFTWFIIIVFLGVAAYLIFGSWLNYNRYSARGWDLVPHSDTIRDIPYLLRDWIRRVVDTVQGGHSRAGYSAV